MGAYYSKSFSESLAPGLAVFEVHSNGSWNPHTYTLRKVARVTATQVTLDNDKRFMRATGREYGGNATFGRGSWLADPQSPGALEAATRSLEERRRRTAINRARTAWDKLYGLRENESPAAEDWEQIAARLEAALTFVDLRKRRKEVA